MAVLKLLKKFFIFAAYCSPAIVALALIIPSYYERTQGIGARIKEYAYAVHYDKIDSETISAETDLPKKEKLLLKYFFRNHFNGNLEKIIGKIDEKIFNIWLTYSIFIGIMTLLPFILLGMKIGFRYKRTDIVLKDRFYSIIGDWWMKLLVAYAIATGWLYAINPEGRGGSTLTEYIHTQDAFTGNTLPGFIHTAEIPLVVAGILGWYLNLVTYFISKLYYDDVYGTRVYRFLVGKLLFVYGISLMVSSMDIQQGKVLMFLIGYFPLTALSILKEYGIKAMQGGAQEKGSLAELPSISRNQILRLHEEGIESINTLASYPRLNELKKYQYAIAPMVDFWVDSARLYSIIGQEKALQLREFCNTASEFLRSYKTPKFRKNLETYGVKNPDEVARLLKETFSFDKKLLAIKPEKF